MRGPLRAAAFIARRDLVYLLRQRETLLWTFVMPVIFFYFIGTVTGGMSGPSEDRPDRLALLAPVGSGFLVDELADRLEAEAFAVERVETESQLARQGRRLRILAPEGHAGFTEAVLAGEPVELQFGHAGEGPAARYDEVRVRRAVYGLLADLVVLTAGDASTAPGGDPGAAPESGPNAPEATARGALDSEDFRRLASTPRSLTLSVHPAGERVVPPSGYEQTIPGTTVMFTMLIMLSSGSIMLVVERRQGLLRRLASTPLSRGAIVGGKLGARMGLGVVQIAFGMVAGTLLFGMDWGRSLWMIALILVAWALFNATLGMVLGNVARTEPQVIGLGITATMVLAALGGCWWPIEITPQWMQGLALALPTGWAMDAMHKLISFGYAPGTTVPHLVALLLGSGTLGWVAARTFRYQ